jgi:hypothetical protein
MRHVRLHAAAGIVLAIDSLRGEMISRDPASPPVFDDQRSYVLKVATADISVDMPSPVASDERLRLRLRRQSR